MSCWHRQVRVGLRWCIAELVVRAVVAGVVDAGAAVVAGAVLGAAGTAGAAAGDDGPECEVPVDPEDSRVV